MTDLLLLVAIVVFAISGYRQGLVVGVLSLTGFLAGGAFGLWLAPRLLGGTETGVAVTLFGIGLVLLAAVAGQVLAVWYARRLRGLLTWQPVRAVDSVGGALVSVVGLLIGAWLLGSLVTQLGATGPVAHAVQDSRVIGAVDRILPDPADRAFSSFGDLLDSTGFPRVFGGFGSERILPVDAPDEGILASPMLEVARASMVKVTGAAEDCGQQVEGSGFVYAPDRVMTNAHVVAGVDNPQVQVQGQGRSYRATVVVFDPNTDVAVLAVQGLGAPALFFGQEAKRGADAVVVGFPNDGPLTATAARIRTTVNAAGEDIYGQASVTREVYSIRGEVRPGNSGGPLLSADGLVYGVVFAASLDDPTTGYVLTADEVRDAARAGMTARQRVGSGHCS